MNGQASRCRGRSRAGVRFAIAGIAVSVLSSLAVGQPSVEGEWNEPVPANPWPLEAQHAVNLHTGKVLLWKHPAQGNMQPHLWDPRGSFTVITANLPLGCSGPDLWSSVSC